MCEFEGWLEDYEFRVASDRLRVFGFGFVAIGFPEMSEAEEEQVRRDLEAITLGDVDVYDARARLLAKAATGDKLWTAAANDPAVAMRSVVEQMRSLWTSIQG